MNKKNYYLAIDMGASGGRHILGHVEDEKLILEEIHRFSNAPRRKGDSLTWDTEGLFREIAAGIKRCGVLGKSPNYIGIDTWGVDYVLAGKNGKILEPAYSYRDSRTAAYLDTPLPFEELYAVTGTARQPFNTLYQLLADKAAGRLDDAAALFFLPEYFSRRLTGDPGGERSSEYTVASTSGLMDAEKRSWAFPIIERLGLPPALFAPPREPPYPAGPLEKKLAEETGCGAEVLMVASHDTASAVSVTGEDDLYISSGTWSLLGIQSSPILTEAARSAGYTNEGALNGRVRFLKNIMGLWVLQQTRHELGDAYSFAELESMAREAEGKNANIQPIDINLPRFLNPPSMINEIKDEYRGGSWIPGDPGELAYCIYLSLASSYKRAVDDLEAITGKKYPVISIIGGGSKDAFLNSLSARYTGREIHAGPSEATAIGNILLQMRYAGEGRPRRGFTETVIKL
ncbi:MAG: rhamnulokinase [Treponema sp.]|jgi:rhamnulokinase|nr:rhamnulokinase [Treponema sp.]